MDKEFKTIYAGKEISIKIPEANLTNIVAAHTAPLLKNPEEKLKKLLENPIGGKKLVDLVKAGDKVTLISSEYNRMPFTWILAPVVIDLLKKEGVKEKPKDIRVSEKILKVQLNAYIARNFLDNEGFFPIIREIDNTLERGLETLK